MAKAPTSSELRFRVRFEKKTPADSKYGKKSSDWVPQFSRNAAIRPLQGSEDVMAQRVASKQPALIIVRYDGETKTIKPSWRAVELDGETVVKVYAIKTAEDMERKRQWLTMLAVDGDADAQG